MTGRGSPIREHQIADCGFLWDNPKNGVHPSAGEIIMLEPVSSADKAELLASIQAGYDQLDTLFPWAGNNVPVGAYTRGYVRPLRGAP
jgi:hypothetical protein